MKNLDYKSRTLFFYAKRREEGHRPQQALSIAKHDAKYGEGSKKLDMMPDRYAAYDGEEITTLPNGWKIRVGFQRDEDHGKPWKECDGHGVIIETNYREDHMDDWELNSDRWWYCYYDWKATLPTAIRDGWDSKPYGGTDKYEKAMRAMRADCEWLRRWCQDDWWWVGMIVTLLDEDDTILDEDSCWGFDSDSIDYLCSEARDWAQRMIRKERKTRREATRQRRIESRFSDAMRLGV